MLILFSYKNLVSLCVAGIIVASASSAATIKTLHTFTGPGGDGTPVGGLATDGTGMLYGVTADGGYSASVSCQPLNGCGTIFSVDPSTGKFTVVHKFTEAEGFAPVGPLVSDGAGGFYGITSGGGACTGEKATIFRFDVAKKTVTVLSSIPSGEFTTAPVLVKGGLYGTYDGTGVFGGIYRFDLAAKTLKSIDSPNSGKNPADGIIICSFNPGFIFDPNVIIDKDGRIYGEATGATNAGKLFRIGPATNRIAGVHALTAKDGGSLSGPLTAAADGTLYGTTAQGGILCCVVGSEPCSSDCNEIFKFDPALYRFTVLHRFTGIDNVSSPEGTTALSPNGKFLYGLTSSGGTQGRGALYRLNVETKEFALLHVFTGSADGAIGNFGLPGLKFTRDGLFGTTIAGGNPKLCYQQGCGTVFQLIP